MGLYGDFTNPCPERFWASALAANQVLYRGFGDLFAAQASQMTFGALLLG